MPATGSEAIDAAVALACAEGWSVRERSAGWSRMRLVVHMAEPLADRLRDWIAADARLRFWRAAGDPHYPAECGFTDERAQVAIAFPA